ncbi:uncharacterized protein LOC126787331 [Argentina anserina]|uniref:uncharacterized protein LOC126787331 n=1 Tax=Argentina anserina TaxID=57926 RepID=UPI002176442A|nr:uncharacterized protein LOC126787331 [Potentilla anserina]
MKDLYGCIKIVSLDYEVNVKWTEKMQTVRKIKIVNLRREVLKVSLWGDPAKNFDCKAIQEMPQSVFAVITSLRITMYKNELIASGGDHTCIILNPDIDEKEEYKAKFSEVEDKMEIVKPNVSEKPNENNTKTVSQLYELNPKSCKDDAIYCKASIVGFLIQNGWWYKGCTLPNCFKILKKNDNNELACIEHDTDTGDKYLPCYRVSMMIDDGSDETTITLMGKQAEQLFGCNCEELVNKLSLRHNKLYQKQLRTPLVKNMYLK